MAAAGLLGAAALAAPAQAQTGGAAPEPAPEVVGAAPAAGELGAGPTGRARAVGGRAMAPAGAPPQVVAAIAAANRIVGRPYRYGGGHSRGFEDTGYDCSGAVSYALRGAGLLRAPLDSGSFMRWGAPGRGRWITIYTNPGHAYVVIAGLRFDTSLGDRGGLRSSRTRQTPPRGTGPRWGGPRSPAGFTARHPVGL